MVPFYNLFLHCVALGTACSEKINFICPGFQQKQKDTNWV